MTDGAQELDSRPRLVALRSSRCADISVDWPGLSRIPAKAVSGGLVRLNLVMSVQQGGVYLVCAGATTVSPQSRFWHIAIYLVLFIGVSSGPSFRCKLSS